MRLAAVLLAAVVWLAACVADPMAPTADLASGGDDLATADLGASVDLVLNQDFTPSDLLTSDLVPTFVEANVGLYGGYVSSLAASANGTVYAATDRRVFRSTDQGANWAPLDGLSLPYGRSWTAIARRRATSSAVVVGRSDGAVFRSLSGGASFLELTGGGATPRPTSAISALAYVADDLIYAISIDRFYQWDGLIWSDLTSSFSVDPSFFDFAIDDGASNPKVYVATSNGVYESDSGGPWNVREADAAIAVAATGSGADTIYGYLRNDGQSVIVDTGPVPDDRFECPPPVTSPAWSPEHLALLPGWQFVGAGPRVGYLDQECGTSWSHELLAPLRVGDSAAVSVLAVTRTEDGAALYLGTNQGVLKSTTLGSAIAFDERNAGLAALDVWSLAADPTQATRLYAGTERGLYLSINSGLTWIPTPTTGSTLLPKLVGLLDVVAGRTPSTLLFVRTSDHRLFTSLDAGVNWQEVTPPGSPIQYGIALEPGNAQSLYACTAEGAKRSVNAGGDWAPLPTTGSGPLDCRAIAVHPGSSQYVYVVDSLDVVWQSQDRGDNFVKFDETGGWFYRMALDPADADRVLIARGALLLEVVDGVVNTTGPINPSSMAIDGLAIDPAGSPIYLSTEGQVYRSDNGIDFSLDQSGLPPVRANFIWINPNQRPVVSLQGLGLWRRP